MATNETTVSKNNNSQLESVDRNQNAIIDSIATVVDAKLKQLQYDITVEAVVVDDTKWETGEYKVKTGESLFTALSESKRHYTVGEKVYVSIPKGDYKNDKFIIGHASSIEEEDIYNYHFPFEDFLQLKELIAHPSKCNYRANQPKSQLDNNDTKWEIMTYNNPSKTPLIGDKLGLSVDITALLSDWRILSGNYGLEIILTGNLRNEKGEVSDTMTKNYKFDIRNMYGNPYVYPVPTRQEIVFDISDIFHISTLQVNFWQDPVNEPFISDEHVAVNWKHTDGTKVQPNLIFENLYVYTGKLASELNGNEVYLYTYDSTIYGEEPDHPSGRTNFDNKTMYMALVYKDPNTQKYVLYDSEEEFAAANATIYWYVKDPNYTLDTVLNSVFNDPTLTEEERATVIKDYHKYCGNYWSPMSKDNAPDSITTHSEPVYGKTSLTFLPDIAKSSYKFRVVVALNGTHISSDILIFSNQIDVESQQDSLAMNNKVILRNALMLSNDDGTITLLYPDDSLQNFYVYDENNRVLNTSDTRVINYHYTENGVEHQIELHGIDNVPFSDINYITEIWIRDDKNNIVSDYRELGSYVRLADWKDDLNQYVPFTVTWDLPSDDKSMMHFRQLGPAEQATLYYNARTNVPVYGWENVENQFDIDRLCSVVFNIQNTYSFMRSDNTIAATITRNGQTYTAKREYMFGKALAQGCEYTPVINVNLPEGNQYLVTNSAFELECQVYDRYGKPIEQNYECNWTFLGDNAPISSLTYGDSAYGANAILHGRTTEDPTPWVVTVTVSGAADYTIHARRGMRICNNATFLSTHEVVCPERVEFNSTGQAPIYYTGEFICRNIGAVDDNNGVTDPERYFYPIWKLHIDETLLKEIVRLKVEEKYISEKRAVLSTDAYDNNLIYYYIDYTVMDYVRYDPDEDDNLHTQWHKHLNDKVLYYAAVIPYVEFYNSNGENSSAPNVSTYRLIYAPGKNDGDVQGGVSTFWQWKDEYATQPQYLTWLSFEYLENNQSITVTQAIAYDRRLYPSSLVNSWDGTSLTLDYETGAILATMIAAGTKDYENRFTGVMMGNWVAHGDESFDSSDSRSNASGIYGFHNGASSFAFLDDGTGYIGPSGKGRIQFDGRNALISNSTKSCYLNLNPNQLTETGEGWTDITNQGISPYFLYCRVPIDAARMINQSTEANLAWGDKFMNDDDNNYFIVDPAHGALMSGGIVSKYGRIGNWYINSTGLYQKYIDQTAYDNQGNYVGSTKNRYIYLGMPGISKTEFNNIWDSYQEALDEIERQRLISLGEAPPDMGESTAEHAFAELLPYLKRNAFNLDVFHYFSTWMAIKDNVDYIESMLDAYAITPGMTVSEDTKRDFLDSLYNLENIVTGLYTYDNVNEFLHNHYTSTGVATGIQGTFPNLGAILGISWGSTINSTTGEETWNYTTPRGISQYYYYNPAEGYSSGERQTWIDPETNQMYFTKNRLGIIRIYSYDPMPWRDNSIISLLSVVQNFANASSSFRSVNFDFVSESSMRGRYWEPRRPEGSTNAQFERVWNSASEWPKAVTISIDHSRLSYNDVDFDYLFSLLNELKIYIDYFRQFYNQCLYVMLYDGIEVDLKSQNDPTDYLAAMQIIDSPTIGGWNGIKAAGVENIGTIEIDIDFGDNVSEEDIARLMAARRAGINAVYDERIRIKKQERADAIRRLYNEFDAEKYAIYTGYNSPLDSGLLDPLFGVKWNGYLIARHGRIGKDSPWYIGDAGLTQTNNFGTIFLGSPDQDGSPAPYYQDINGSAPVPKGQRTVFLADTDHGAVDLNADNGLLLPNGSKINEKIAVIKDSEAYKENLRAIQAESSNYVVLDPTIVTMNGHTNVIDNNHNYPYTGQSNIDKQYLGPEAYGLFGNFAIYAGAKSTGIRFGVRLDGTLYARRAQFDQVKIVGSTATGLAGTQISIDNSTNDSATMVFASDGIVNIDYGKKQRENGYSQLYQKERILAGGTLVVNHGYIVEKETIEYLDLNTNIETYLDYLQEVTSTAEYDGMSATEKSQRFYGTETILGAKDYLSSSLSLSKVSVNDVLIDLDNDTTTELNTNVTITDSTGTRYYYKDSDGNWHKTATTFSGLNIHKKASLAALLGYIAKKDAMLLGGDLTGWQQNSTMIANMRILPSSSGEYVESIALDAGNNQIRLANSQIVLDGTNGVVFIGAPKYSSNEIGLVYTDAHLLMGNINITAHTEGLSEYQATIYGGASNATLTTTTVEDSAIVRGHNWSYTNSGVYEESNPIGESDTPTDWSEISSSGDSDTDEGATIANTVRGTTTIAQMTVTGARSDATTTTYGGFYTICYDQTSLLATPRIENNVVYPTIAGKGGLGIAFKKTGDTKIALYPFNDDSQLGFQLESQNSQGQTITKYYRWNISATSITASKNIWIIDKDGNRDPVVCAAAFQAALNIIYNSLDQLATAVSANAKDTAQALSDANRALSAANTALSKIDALAKKAVCDVELEGTSLETVGWYKLNVTKNDTTTAEYDMSLTTFSTPQHTHQVGLRLQNGYLSAASGSASGSYNPLNPSAGGAGEGYGSVDLYDVVSNLEGDGTAGTLTWSTLGGGNGSFNIADTTYFQQRGYGSYSIGNYASSTKTYPLTITAVDGSTELDSDDIDVTAAYNAGWQAAAAEFKRVGNTIYGPSSTVGSNDYYSASVEGGGATGGTTGYLCSYRKANDSAGNVPSTYSYIYYSGSYGTYYTGGSSGSVSWNK